MMKDVGTQHTSYYVQLRGAVTQIFGASIPINPLADNGPGPRLGMAPSCSQQYPMLMR